MQPYPSSEPLSLHPLPAEWGFLLSSPHTSDAEAASPPSFTPTTVATTLRVALFWFVAPLLYTLDQGIDRRLVRTFVCTLEAIVRLRHRAHGLLLSELGAYLMPPEHAPAGTKRLSNLLHSAKWSANIISAFLWQQALTRHQQMIQEQMIQKEDQQPPLLLWDESVIEKPESLHAEGLCPVRSSKAKRLTHIKPGFYTPPTKPIFVPGMNWISLLLCGPTGAPLVAAMQWWTTRGPLARDKRTLQIDLLKRCTQAFGTQILHVFDRGYAGNPWLELLIGQSARFLMRWPARYRLVADGDPMWEARCASDLMRGKRSMDHRWVWDAVHQRSIKLGLVYRRVWDPSLKHRWWLVVCRRGDGHDPWYLLTTETVTNTEEGWRLVMAYARRWQIEQCWRYNKSELAMESPRLWHWEQREKLAVDGDAGLCVPVVFARGAMGECAHLVVTVFLPSNGKAEPPNGRSALSVT